MLSWLAKKVLDHNYARLRAGDYRPTLRLDARDLRRRDRRQRPAVERVTLDAAAWDEFAAILDRPPRDNPKLRALFERPDPFV